VSHNQEQGTDKGQNGNAEVSDPATIEVLQAQLKEKDSKYLYLYAEFENYKRRAEKERSDILKYGWEGVAADLLQVADNLDRAIVHLPKACDASVEAGLKLVLNQFQGALKRKGVEAIEAKHKTFDPNFHEAVSQEVSEEFAAGVITQELEKGYTLFGRLLRPSRVVVSSGKNT
jgi:molecular chaperone GrpE